jgi:hypothetical protein
MSALKITSFNTACCDKPGLKDVARDVLRNDQKAIAHPVWLGYFR